MATMRTAERHPSDSATRARTGKKSSWPVAVLAVSAPITRPRRALNQRVTTTAPRTRATMPVPMPTRRPQSTTRCQGLLIAVARSRAAARIDMAKAMVRRTPMRSAMAAQNGPISP
jgi:hypothetical protein